MGWNFPTGREDKRRVLLEAVEGVRDRIEALSRIDASAAWCVMIGATTIALQAVFLPDEAISQMFGGGQMPTAAGALMPTGEAIPAPGGYRVTGRWAFASGIRHAQWVNATVRVRQSDRDFSEWRRVVLPVSRVTIHDNWDVVGLKGTGSCDFSVTDCFVPEAFSWGFHQVPRRGGRLYHLSCRVDRLGVGVVLNGL